MQKRYKGLSNIGATCYMNSLLQTLFMTPQFRYSIYKWKYNQKIHPKEVDSIIFQLQKLFAKLQTDFPSEVSTKQLVKSFQWEDQQAQMQQDIQEFNRLLFEALQKSLNNKSEKYIHNNFVKNYFQGELIHYTKCYECENESARQEYFQDVIITVKNIYQKIYNGSLELGLQRYLKPEILDQNNLYECSNCNKKTKAQRGARFIKMPYVFNIILQRFSFNYFTMERQKINDQVEFPFILNFNDYIHGYDKIPNRRNEDSSQYFKYSNYNGAAKSKASSKPFSTSNKSLGSAVKKKSNTPSIAGKTAIKPSANTKSFLAQMRKRKTMAKQQNQDLFFVSGNTVIPDLQMAKSQSMCQKEKETTANQNQINKNNNTVKSQEYQIYPIQAERQLKNLECIEQIQKQRSGSNNSNHNSNQLVSTKETFQKQDNQQDFVSKIQTPEQLYKKGSKVSDKNETANKQGLVLPPPPPTLDIVPNNLSVPYKMIPDDSNKKTIQSQLEQKIREKQKLNKEKEEKLMQLQKKNQELITKYLKEGPLVYELYAVLVHNGTANHGHYYSYIKSFESQKWYCFNDERVSQINVSEIEKTFGGGNTSNAYALYYRLIESTYISMIFDKRFQNTLRKSYKYKKPNQKKDNNKKCKIQRILSPQRYIINCMQDNFKFINLIILIWQWRKLVSYLISLNLKQKDRISGSECLIPSLKQSWRLLVGDSTYHQKNQKQAHIKIFYSKQRVTLSNSKSMRLVQFIQELHYWNKIKIQILQTKTILNFINECRVSIKRFALLKEIIKAIADKRNQILQQNQDPQNICIIKKHQNNDETIHQLLTISDNYEKNIDDLFILENEVLFVEPKIQQLVWPQQFENELYRISIKYNKPPGTNSFQNYQTDSRITIQQLKNQLCIFLQENPEDLIMKWGTKSGRELKDLTMTLKEARFITGTQVYFDHGMPAKPGEVRIQLYLATDASPQNYNRLHQFEYITDVPISGALKASQVKQKFIKVIKKMKDIDLKPEQFRIRERVSEKIGKIYRQKPMKQQQLIQKRQIAIEMIPEKNLDSKQFSIYFRIWDQQNWQLSKKIEVIVNKNTTMKEVAQNLAVNQQNKILKQSTQMSICRILSIHKFNIIDLTAMQWFEMNHDIPVIGQPMFVNADGLLYIIKNSNHAPRQLTKQQQTKFGGTIRPAVVRNGVKSTYRPKEGKGMKIKVVEKQQQPQKQQQAQQSKVQKNKG